MKYIKVLFRQYTQAIVLRIYLLSSLLEVYCHFYSLITCVAGGILTKEKRRHLNTSINCKM